MTDAEKIAALRAALTAAKISHAEQGDPYYSCPKSESGANYWKHVTGKNSASALCDCGADEHNAAIDSVLGATQ